MATYALRVGDTTRPVDQQPWQLDGEFCPEPGCGLAATRGTSHWTQTTATTTVRTYTYGCLAGHTWTHELPGHCPDRPADDTAENDSGDNAAGPPATEPEFART